MEIARLNQMVADDAAIRRRQRLQPVGGQGDKIFPPTYPGAVRGDPPQHVYEVRNIAGDMVWCVLVDSVQSQANRLEESLSKAVADGVSIPHIMVDLSAAGLTGVTRITSLEAPHRVYDAIFRDSNYKDEPFMASAIGKRLATASLADASALLEVSPAALIFGAWHSTGEGGGLGAKFPRCLTSEIIAVNVPVDAVIDERSNEVRPRNLGRRTGSRIDPLGILRRVEVYKAPDGNWATTADAAGKGAKRVRPSEINHGNIAPTIEPLGITCDYLEHTIVLSFAGLRRLRFGSEARTVAGRSLLAALGLLALVEQDARGYALRSRCDLVCEGRAPLELVHPDGSTDEVSLDREAARALYRAAYQDAARAGFDLSAEPLRLEPQEKLVEIIRRSQELALSGEGGDEGDATAKS